MIKVYIYVTGLVLYQFSGDGSLATRALLAAGGYNHPGLGHVCHHEVRMEVGPQEEEIEDPPTQVRFTVPPGQSSPVSTPSEIPDLGSLVTRAKVREECTKLGHPELCTLPGSPQSATNGLLEFVGAWRTVGLSDCDTGYPDQFEDAIKFDFVRATRSWELRAKPSAAATSFANSVLFVTEITSLSDLKVSETKLGDKLQVASSADCRGLPGFIVSGATGCIVMIVRNGSTEAYQGGGDLHFASLYSFLEYPPSADETWLPIKVEGEACPGGGGTGGLSRCVGGKVIQ